MPSSQAFTSAFITFRVKSALSSKQQKLGCRPGNEPGVLYIWQMFERTCTLLSLRNPDEGGVKLKMLYASSKDAIKKVFTGLPGEFQVNDRGDLEYDHFAEEIEKKA